MQKSSVAKLFLTSIYVFITYHNHSIVGNTYIQEKKPIPITRWLPTIVNAWEKKFDYNLAISHDKMKCQFQINNTK
jgi:hypothetical protein